LRYRCAATGPNATGSSIVVSPRLFFYNRAKSLCAGASSAQTFCPIVEKQPGEITMLPPVALGPVAAQR